MEYLEAHTVGLSSSSWVIIGYDIFGGVGVCRNAVGDGVGGVFLIFCAIICDDDFLFQLHRICELHSVYVTTTYKIDYLIILVLLSVVPYHKMQLDVLLP